MKKFVFILMVVLMATTVMAAVQRQIQFVDEYGYPIAVSKVTVYDYGTATTSTIYKDRALSNAITIPMDATSTNTGIIGTGLVQWFSRSAKKYDIEAYAGGTAVRLVGVTDAVSQVTVIGTNATGGIKGKGMFDDFVSHPIAVAKLGAGAATGTAGDENLLYTGKNYLEYHIVGTQTIVGPKILATGLEISMDEADDDGMEYCPGIIANDSSFTVGADGAFSFSCELDIPDVSGTDDCLIGFRKLEAYQADPSDYDEMAAFNIQAGVINIETVINDGETITDTTLTDWADGGNHVLKVSVSATGVVTFEYDGVEPTVVPTFTFDDAEVVVPFAYMRHAATIAEDTAITDWNCRLA